ncbi:MAG: hypothetical protein E6I76_20880 [Chloroflexi bacterium]|nr:MAG: hypothetical protein E6I76_20880 [Chloroflexota bacterium]
MAVVYPAVWPLSVTVEFQPMSATAISLAWVVTGVVPVEAAVPLPPSLAIWSSGVDDAPVRSSTVKASADVALSVTVTPPGVVIVAAFAANQISPSACP